MSNIHSLTCFCYYLEHPMSASFFLRPTFHGEIHHIFSNLKDGSNGHANIDDTFAEYIPNVISNLLAHVINLFMSSIIVPTSK